MPSALELKLRQILKENLEFDCAEEEIGLEAPLTQYGLNSVTFIKTVLAIEAEFGITFDDEALVDLEGQNIKNWLSYIESKSRQKMFQRRQTHEPE